ncbi:DUF4843 domain-containing protein [Carboxylicivirga sp. A043]|uniref:DUF4843 domain-containing protein n=1 Tax=Carboxylicivirga litoralis TaxID=2816963 RepID=UPI0021CAEE13|nr:DUF4843 domain-containing protein [Carboxylicivirga sp. A043]MCU4158290.1 DUF4843 domain-containing protein [Carboxylicivirga sp. A043]
MKKKIFFHSLCLVAISLLWHGCSEEKIDKYNSEASLFFYDGYYNLNGVSQYGSFAYSFFYAESSIVKDTVWVDVRLTGFQSEEDRTISMVQLNTDEEGAAIAGIHYIAFNAPQLSNDLILPAGATSILVPIVILKTDDMETEEFTLEFGFSSNESFVPGLIDQSTFIVTMTAMAVKPSNWDDDYYKYAFGEWGQEKMRFLIDYVGFTDFSMSLINSDIRKYYNMKANALLKEYEETYGPIYESDGVTRVIFP